MSVRRLLVLFLLVGSLLALPVPSATAGPRTTAEFVCVTNAARRAHHLRPMAVSPTLTKLARAHSGAMARRAAARYGGRCDGRALWHNDISRKAGRWAGWARTSAAAPWAATTRPRCAGSRPPSWPRPATGATSCTAGPPTSGSAPGSAPAGSSGSRSTSSRRRPADPGRAVSFDRAPITMAPSARSVVGR